MVSDETKGRVGRLDPGLVLSLHVFLSICHASLPRLGQMLAGTRPRLIMSPRHRRPGFELKHDVQPS